MPVVLPQGGKESGEEVVTVHVSGDGAVFWNREPVERAALPARLAHYRTQVENLRVLVASDERARFGTAVVMLDALRKAGISQFSVETRPRPTGK